MKEIIIKYENPKTLQLLKSLAKYFNFSISFPKKQKENKPDRGNIKGVPFIPGDRSIDIKQLTSIFTGKNIDAKQLRVEGWQRQK